MDEFRHALNDIHSALFGLEDGKPTGPWLREFHEHLAQCRAERAWKMVAESIARHVRKIKWPEKYADEALGMVKWAEDIARRSILVLDYK